jgi:hypothetical protein
MILYYINLLISPLSISLDYMLSPSLYLLYPSLTYALMSNMLIIVLLGLILGSK